MKDLMQSEMCARKLRTIADPDRLRIIQCLRDGPKCVGDIAEILEIPLVNISHHLRVLRDGDMVRDERNGRFVIYHLNPDVYRPADCADSDDHLDFGCCRIDIPQERKLVEDT